MEYSVRFGARIADSIRSRLSKRLLCILIAGIILRFALVPLVFNYDMGFFIVTGSGFESGRTLYETGDFYYPPVYGYFLSIFTYFWNIFSIDSGTTSELLVSGLKSSDFQLSYISSLSMAVAYKLPLIIIDFVCSWLIYDLVRMKTGDVRKAELGFALFFLSPLVMWSSSVAGMFDSLSALFLIFSIYALIKDQYALSGAMMSMGFFTKIFPIVTGFAVLFYIIAKSRNNRKHMLENSLRYLFGFIVLSLIILLPIIISGEMTQLINSAIGDRMVYKPAGDGSLRDFLLMPTGDKFSTVFPILFIIIAVACTVTFIQKGDIDKKYVMASSLSLCVLFMWPPVPTYNVVAIALISLVISYNGRMEWIIAWIIFSTLTVIHHIFLFGNRLFYTIANETSLIDLETVANVIMQDIFPGITHYTGLLTYVPGITSLILAIFYFSRRKEVGH